MLKHLFPCAALLLAAGPGHAADDGNGATVAMPRPLLHEMFQDHAVLQRDRPIPIWGDAGAHEALTLTIEGRKIGLRADGAGHWQTELPPMPAGGPYSLTVRTQKGASQTIADLLVGDVFLCSGQSNMEFPVRNSLNAAREVAGSGNDSIRLLSVTHAGSPTALGHFLNPVAWSAAAPASVPEFSAACLYFARELRKSVAVPIGLIHSSWGGSRIEPWISDSRLRGIGGFDQRLDLLRSYVVDPASGNAGMGALWESWWRSHDASGSAPWNSTSDAGWHEVPEPMRDWKTWGVPELVNHDGMVWFRRTLTLTAAQASQVTDFSTGAIDEVDETWVNGRPIGNSFGYGTERTYRIPAGILHAGENSIVVNVLSTYDMGGMYGPPEHIALHFADSTLLPLGGHWHYQFVPESMGFPPRAPWESVAGLTSIYNAMIAPIEPYGLRGVLWYQGESNAAEADRYQALLRGLMADWRARFHTLLPFLIVQLPNFGKPPVAPMESDWANLREAQRRAVAADPNAALAITIDLGEARELHPPNKQAVGMRLAQAARHLIYGEPVSASGPTPHGARREGAQVVIDFDTVDGLRTYSGLRPTGFELCGAEPASCRFADASMRGNSVVLTLEGPATRVRHCWSDAPLCNLHDAAGLPAGPFEIEIR
jgi:sialate O-acetylesterase